MVNKNIIKKQMLKSTYDILNYVKVKYKINEYIIEIIKVLFEII